MNRIISIYLSCLFLLFSSSSIGQTWQVGPDYPSDPVARVFQFVIDDVLYVGCGRDESGTNLNEVWAYYWENQIWVQKANFPGGGRGNAFTFSDGQFGYMGMGNDGFLLSDFWKYDPDLDEWTQLPNFPGVSRGHTVAISGNDKAYFISGGDADLGLYLNDIWEYEFATETWSWLFTVPSFHRWRAFGFMLNDKIYFGGGGQFQQEVYQDFWEYDPATSIWTEKSSFPTNLSIGCNFFSLDNKGYVLSGTNYAGDLQGSYDTGMYIYDPLTDEWSMGLDFIGTPRIVGFGATVGDQAIVGLGRNLLTNEIFNDIYIYAPLNTSVLKIEETAFEIFPNPVRDQIQIEFELENQNHISLKVYDLNGREMVTWMDDARSAGKYALTYSLENMPSGTYQLVWKLGTRKGVESLMVVK